MASIHDQYESREEKKSFNHQKSSSLSLLVLTFVVSFKRALTDDVAQLHWIKARSIESKEVRTRRDNDSDFQRLEPLLFFE